jgi:protein ImuB
MFRYLVAYIPHFRLDRCGWSPDQPAILVAEKKNALRVQAATLTSQKAGIRQGMSVSEARARCPHLETELLDDQEELNDLHDLTAQLLRISPYIAPLPPDSIIAEVGHPDSGLAGQERSILERVRIRMKQLGHAAHVVIADDPFVALYVAKWKQQSTIIPKGGSTEALNELPLEALSITPKDLSLLHSLGIKTIGQFSKLPAAELCGRFGPRVIAEHALSSGQSIPPQLHAWPEKNSPSISQELPDPVTELEALFFVIGAMIRDLTTRLIARNQAMTQVDLIFRFDDGRHQAINLRIGPASRHAPTILDQIRHRLEKLQLNGPVVGLTLSTHKTTSFDGRQIDLRDPHRRDEAVEVISAQLQDVLGSRSVLGARTTPRHRPEGAWRPVPFGIATSHHTTSAAAKAHHADPVEAWEGYPPKRTPERPPILLKPPVVIEVHSESEPYLNAIHMDGRWIDVVHLLGPEQIAGEWWASAFQRLYWRAILDDGRTAWVYKEQGRWLLHGWWDR